jgi:hypothetical protein
VDEVRVVVSDSLGGRIAMDEVGTGLAADGSDVHVEATGAWAHPNGANFVPVWPASGLIRIGDELMFYTSAQAASLTYLADVLPRLAEKQNRHWRNELHPNNNDERKAVWRLAGLKRGLLGTQAADHPVGAPIMLYDTAPFSVLQGDFGDATADTFTVQDGRHWPEEGYAWIDNEVVSFTSRAGAAFRGCRPYRGCFGTDPSLHGAGALTRCLPSRYWHRAAREYDGDGQAHVQASHAAPGAVWEALEVKIGAASTPLAGLCRPRILVRFDGKPGWDAQPSNLAGGLFEFDGAGVHVLRERGRRRGGVNADQIEVRVFWDYGRGAFQPSPDWKRTFMLEEVRATYYHPLVIRLFVEVERR